MRWGLREDQKPIRLPGFPAVSSFGHDKGIVFGSFKFGQTFGIFFVVLPIESLLGLRGFYFIFFFKIRI